MAEDIKALIDKINQEGIAVAEEKAKEIEQRASFKAEQIKVLAKQEAEKRLAEADERIMKMQEKEKTELAQAGRDLLLTLRQEINVMLDKLITQEVRNTLNPENLFKILSNVIKCASGYEKSEIIISLNKEDLKILEQSFLAKLKDEVRHEIVLQPQDSIHGGFIISFDKGRSQFDFSDKALAEYIGTSVRPRLKEILQG